MSFKMKKVPVILNVTILCLLFAVAAFVVITYSAGYVIDFENKSIEPTSILQITARPADSKILLDGSEVGAGSIVLKNLKPGEYDFEISKEGYHSFDKKITLEPSRVLSYESITLFKDNISSKNTNEKISKDALAEIADTEGLLASDGEIYINGELVTRFSDSVSGVCWYPGHGFISFTAAGKLKIMYKDGSNVVDLVKKDSDSPVIFVNSGRSVIFEDENKVWEAQVR